MPQADRAGAVISYGAGAEVAFPIQPLHDGQRLSLGQVTLEILATPGHTPSRSALLSGSTQMTDARTAC